MTQRGTTNSNKRGSSRDRRARRTWIVGRFRADVDIGDHGKHVGHGLGLLACRCYRCGTLLTVHTVTIDRIIPGCEGGTYRRNNIRPSCMDCASATGAFMGNERRARS